MFLARRSAFPRVVAGGVLAAVVLSGCSSSDSSSDGTAAATPHAGGTLVFGASSNPTCLDPHQLSENVSLTVGRQVVDSLTDQDPDSGEIVPWLAESWEVNDDATQFTFHLRDGVTFSDGTPLDAAAVKANLDDIVTLGPRSLLGATYLAAYDRTETPDDSTVVVAFSQPNAQFLQATATITLGILAPATLAEDPADRCLGQLVGSGPYLLDGFENNQAITLSRRAGYDWPTSLAEHSGDAYLDSIEFRIAPDAGVRSGSLTSGQLDGIQDVQPQDEDRFRGNGFAILSRANPGLVTSLIPNERGLLADEDVRHAIQVGIDRDEIVATVASAETQAATSVLAATTPGYVDVGDDLAHDPDAARQILDDAGWVEGSDGIRVKDGQRLTLRVLGATGFGELVQQQLKDIGVDVQLVQITSAQQYQAIQSSGEYELAVYNLTRSDPSVLSAVFSTEYTNVPRRTAGPLDDVLAQLGSVSDPDERAAVAEEAQRTIVAEADALPLMEQTQVYAFSDDVHDVVFEASSRMRLYDAWVS